VLFGALSPLRCYFRYQCTGDKAVLADIDRQPYRAVAGSALPPTQQIFDLGFAEVMSVRNQGKDPKQAARDLFKILEEVDFLPPAFGVSKPEQHAPSAFTVPKMARDLSWIRKRAPAWVRDTFFDWSPASYFKYTLKGLLKLGVRPIRRALDPAQEAFSTWHPHWD
jgi:hypothetical protein